MQMMKTDHTEVVKAIRAQNWKLGGALTMDIPEAETMVYDLIHEATALMHARCVAAAEEELRRIGSGSGGMIVAAVKNVSTLV
jgi:hypothetical protein